MKEKFRSMKVWLKGSALALAAMLFSVPAFALETATQTVIESKATSVIADINTILAIIIGITMATVAARWVIRMAKSG